MKRFILCLMVLLCFTQPVYANRIENQGSTPNCTAYAVANGIEAQMIAQGIDFPKDGFNKKYIIDNCNMTIDGALALAVNGIEGKDGETYKITSYSNIDTTPESICEALTGYIFMIMMTNGFTA